METTPKIINTAKFTTTTLAPAGIENTYEHMSPMVKFITAKIAEQIVTLINDLNILIDVSAGNIIRLDINMAPIIFIPITTVIAVKIDIRVL